MTPQERERHYFDVIDPLLQDLTHRMVEASAMDDAVLQASVHWNSLSYSRSSLEAAIGIPT